MKIFTEKGIFKKLLLVLVVIIAFNAVIPTNVSYAADVGGVLLEPIANLMLTLADLVMDLIHEVLYGMNTAIVRIDKDAGILGWIITAIIVAVVAVALVYASAALLGVATKVVAAVAAKVGATAATTISATAVGVIVTTSIGGGLFAGMMAHSEWFDKEIVMPLYRITPEEIFSGEIRWLNVNFFSEEEITDEDIDTTVTIQNKEEVEGSPLQVVLKRTTTVNGTNVNITEEGFDESTQKVNEMLNNYGYNKEAITCSLGSEESIVRRWSSNEKAYEATLYSSTTTSADRGGSVITTTYNLTIYKGEWIGAETNTIGSELKTTVAKWYYAIRNFALIVMMVILLYIGIRIMLCGIASEKAKYKNMLMDWLVAICLIFIMHYIMAFAMNIVDGLIKIFDSVNSSRSYTVVYEYTNQIENALKDADVDISNLKIEDQGGKRYISWDARNIMGLVRTQAAFSNIEATNRYTYIAWIMCYVVLVCYTVFFLFTYLKRVLYLTFFTIIAPLVAMTYPLDKLHDGKAQAFDMWLKEYIFNLMIQPVHLLLYTVMITSAFDLASANILYTLVAIGFMMPAEKFLRKMFGFDKAQTPGLLSGAAGTALMVSGVNKLFSRRHSKGGSDDYGEGGGKSGGEDSSGKTVNVNKGLLAQAAGTTQNRPASPTAGANQNNNTSPGSVTNNGPVFRGTRSTRTANSPAIPMRLRRNPAQSANPPASVPTVPSGNKKAGFFRRHASAFKRASQDYAKQKLYRTSKNIANGKPIKSLARTLGGLYLGAGGAMLGATFALADDEPIKKMGQYVPTLGAAGYALGSRDSKPDYDVESVYEEYQRGLYENAEEYEKAKAQEEIQKIIDDQKNQRKVRDNMNLDSLEEARDRMSQFTTSLAAGVTNMDDLSTIMRLVDDGKMTEEMAIVASQYYKKAGGKPKNMDKDSKERKHIEHLSRSIAREALGNSATDAQIEQTSKIVLSNLDLYGTYKDKLTEL